MVLGYVLVRGPILQLLEPSPVCIPLCVKDCIRVNVNSFGRSQRKNYKTNNDKHGIGQDAARGCNRSGTYDGIRLPRSIVTIDNFGLFSCPWAYAAALESSPVRITFTCQSFGNGLRHLRREFREKKVSKANEDCRIGHTKQTRTARVEYVSGVQLMETSGRREPWSHFGLLRALPKRYVRPHVSCLRSFPWVSKGSHLGKMTT